MASSHAGGERPAGTQRGDVPPHFRHRRGQRQRLRSPRIVASLIRKAVIVPRARRLKPRLYRRSPSLVAHWPRSEIVVHDFVSHARTPVGRDALGVLTALHTWCTAEDIEKLTGLTKSAITRILAELSQHSFVEVAEDRPDGVKDALPAWAAWGPEATQFHFATRDGMPRGKQSDMAHVAPRPAQQPEPLKKIGRQSPIVLPPYPRQGRFVNVLLSRRSWRRFGDDSLSIEQLATLLGLTWGVQSWMSLEGGIVAPLKTSPSGGACHSLEV